MNPGKHPTSEGPAAAFHGFLALLYILGLAWHVVSAIRHWQDRDS